LASRIIHEIFAVPFGAPCIEIAGEGPPHQRKLALKAKAGEAADAKRTPTQAKGGSNDLMISSVRNLAMRWAALSAACGEAQWLGRPVIAGDRRPASAGRWGLPRKWPRQPRPIASI
jgi:hypothetical protein